MNLFTPFTLLHPATKRNLLSKLNEAVKTLYHFEPGYAKTIKLPIIRAATAIPRACHLCPFSSSLASIMQAHGLPAELNSLPQLFSVTANRLLIRRQSLPPPIDQTGLKVVTWNVTAFSPLENSYKNKLVSKFAADKVVCLQETKMTTEDYRLLELQIPGCRIFATPSVTLETDDRPALDEEAPSDAATAPLSGGVAVLIPTYLCTIHCTQHDLIPGYAVAVTIAHSSFQWCIASIYLRSGQEKELLACLHKELRKLVTLHRIETFLILGDFNKARILAT